jgi:hypothetical protein
MITLALSAAAPPQYRWGHEVRIMHELKPDAERTKAAYELGIFVDKKKRSYVNNFGHVFLRGKDRENRWDMLYRVKKGLCGACGLWRPPHKLDMDHMCGNTPRTRCDCFAQALNDGSICTGIRLLCTLDPRKGGSPKSCHAKKHNREIISDKKARRDASS